MDTQEKPTYTKGAKKKTVTVKAITPTIPGVEFAFTMRTLTESEKRKLGADVLGSNDSEQRMLEEELDRRLLSRLVTEVPQGFGDFPPATEGPLEERMLRYLEADEDLADLVGAVLKEYGVLTAPRTFS